MVGPIPSEVRRKLDLVDALRELADSGGVSLAALALAFAAEHPAVSTVLLGPRTDQQLAELLAAVDESVGADLVAAVDTLVAPGTDVDPLDFVRAPLPSAPMG